MKRRILSFLMALVMVLSLLPASAFAAVTTSGTCGENLTWSLSDGTLTISGTGEMTNYTAEDPAPWSNYAGEIEALVLPDALTSVGSYAFVGFFTGSSYVTPADVRVPESVVRVGDYAFMNCHALNIYFIGDAPEFGTRVFTSMDTSVMHPCSNDTWASAVLGPLKGIYTEETHTSDGNSVVKAPTCCQMGYTYHTCALCSEEYVDYAEPLGHTPDANQICTRCGEDITAKDQFLWDYYDDIGGVMILEYLGNAANVTIPATIDCWPVTHICEYAFHNKDIYSVTIPNTVTNIGDYAFTYCRCLTEITIPDSVTTMGYGVFDGCWNLESVSIGAGVTDVTSLFENCGPAAITISGDNPALCAEDSVIFTKDKSTLLYVPSAKTGSYTVPDGVKTIGSYAFSSTALEEIIMPDSVTTIGEHAFRTAGQMSNVIVDVQLGSGVTELAYRAFEFANMDRIELPEGLQTIGEAAFFQSSLTDVNIPSTVTSVGAEAFCLSWMTSVAIPATVTTIGSRAFGYEDTTYQGSFQKVAGFTIDAPEGSAGYEYAVANGFAVGHTCKFGEWIVTVEPGCETNGTEIATCSCGETIESDINPLGHNFVDGVCTRCGEEEAEIPFYYEDYDDGVMINGYIGGDPDVVVPETINGKPVLAISNFHSWNVEVTSVELPNTVDWIGEYAFIGSSELKSISLPESLSHIFDYAFCDCSKLQSIDLPYGLMTLGFCAFASCSSLESVTLPPHLMDLSPTAFQHCGKLENLYVDPNSRDLYSDNGVVMSSYNSMLVLYPAGREGAYTVPEGIVSIGENAFAYSNVTEITVPDSVTSIGNAAFAGCEYLREATIGNGVTELAYYNFADCTNLNVVNLPKSLVSIGNAVFECTALEEVVLPEGLETIGNGTFYDVPTLTKVTLPSSLTYMGNNVFLETGLNYAVVPAGVTYIGVNAMGLCDMEDENGDPYMGAKPGFVLYGTPGTAAETYANENDIPFVDIAKHQHIFEDGKCIICGSEEKLSTPTNVKIFTVEASGKPRLTWDAVDGATKYEIWRATTENGTYTKMSTQTAVAYTNTTAKVGTTYFYKVRAIDADGNAGQFCEAMTITCACAAPVISVFNNVETGKPGLSWNAVSGAEKYEIWRATSKDGTYYKMYTQKGTTYTNTTAKAGTEYYYKVKALGAVDAADSAFSAVKYAMCACAAPVVSWEVDAATGKPAFVWEAVDGAYRYEIYRAEAEEGTYSRIFSQTETEFIDTTAKVGVTYNYRIRALAEAGTLADSVTTVKGLTCTPARPEVSISTKAASGKPTLSWKAVPGAVKYEISRATKADGGFYKMSTVTGTTYTNTTAYSGSTYYYRVKAIDASGNASAYSVVQSITCAMPQPVVQPSVVNHLPHLYWPAVNGAEKYEIWRSTSEDGTYTKMYTTGNNSYNNTTAKPGNTYYYKVKALDTDNTAANSAFSVPVSVTIQCGAPVITVGNKAATGKPMVSWEAVEGAVRYAVYRSTSENGTYTKMYTQTGTTYTNTTAKAGNPYYYKVVAIGADGVEGKYSAVKGTTCDLASPVVTITIKASTGKPMLTWKAVAGADKYEIWRSTTGETGSFSMMYTTTGTTYTNTTAKAGTRYFYKVRAIYADNLAANSAYSSAKSIYCDLAQPTGVKITTNAGGKPQITWNKVDGAVKYEIWRSTTGEAGSFSKMYTQTSTTYTNTTAKSGVTYYYKVRAILLDNTSASSAYSAIVSIKCK